MQSIKKNQFIKINYLESVKKITNNAHRYLHNSLLFNNFGYWICRSPGVYVEK